MPQTRAYAYTKAASMHNEFLIILPFFIELFVFKQFLYLKVWDSYNVINYRTAHKIR